MLMNQPKSPALVTPQFRYEREMAVFFVDDRDIADAIKKVTRTITMPNTNNLKVCDHLCILYILLI